MCLELWTLTECLVPNILTTISSFIVHPRPHWGTCVRMSSWKTDLTHCTLVSAACVRVSVLNYCTALQPLISCQTIPWTNTLHPHHIGDSLHTLWHSVDALILYNYWRGSLLPFKPIRFSVRPVIVKWFAYTWIMVKLFDFHYWDSWFSFKNMCNQWSILNVLVQRQHTHQLIPQHINMEKG